MKTNKEIKVLCMYCDNPIHVGELGGVQISKNVKVEGTITETDRGHEGWFHKKCYEENKEE